MNDLKFIITEIENEPIEIKLALLNNHLLKEDFEKIIEAYKKHKIVKIIIED